MFLMFLFIHVRMLCLNILKISASERTIGKEQRTDYTKWKQERETPNGYNGKFIILNTHSAVCFYLFMVSQDVSLLLCLYTLFKSDEVRAQRVKNLSKSCHALWFYHSDLIQP